MSRQQSNRAAFLLLAAVVVYSLAGQAQATYLRASSPLDIASGVSGEWTVVHKFGRNMAVGTSYAPVSMGGVYQTPQPAAATTLRVKAGGHADDTAAGDGAREITLIGIDETGAEVTETVATAGASASSATTTTFIRLYRLYVSASGTYATSAAGSHTADIVIENGAGGTDWATIDSASFPVAQSEIGAYTIPVGFEGYVQSLKVISDTTKITRLILFMRGGATDTAAPYGAMRVVQNLLLTGGSNGAHPLTPNGPFAAGSDVGFMAKVDTGTAEVSVDYEILLRAVN